VSPPTSRAVALARRLNIALVLRNSAAQAFRNADREHNSLAFSTSHLQTMAQRIYTSAYVTAQRLTGPSVVSFSIGTQHNRVSGPCCEFSYRSLLRQSQYGCSQREAGDCTLHRDALDFDQDGHAKSLTFKDQVTLDVV
jgi:hypothetical protein